MFIVSMQFVLKENTIAVQKHIGWVESSPFYHNHQNSVTLLSSLDRASCRKRLKGQKPWAWLARSNPVPMSKTSTPEAKFAQFWASLSALAQSSLVLIYALPTALVMDMDMDTRCWFEDIRPCTIKITIHHHWSALGKLLCECRQRIIQ